MCIITGHPATYCIEKMRFYQVEMIDRGINFQTPL
jgi:hypothetical protein